MKAKTTPYMIGAYFVTDDKLTRRWVAISSSLEGAEFIAQQIRDMDYEPRIYSNATPPEILETRSAKV